MTSRVTWEPLDRDAREVGSDALADALGRVFHWSVGMELVLGREDRRALDAVVAFLPPVDPAVVAAAEDEREREALEAQREVRDGFVALSRALGARERIVVRCRRE